MRVITFTALLVLALCITGFGQEPKTRMEPVPGVKPFIMTEADFEKLEYAASIDRFGILSKEIRPRLDRFTELISVKNKTVEYAVLLNGKTIKDAGLRIEFVYRYLTEKKKISSSRISFGLTTTAANETELWLIPNREITIPSCPNCIIVAADDEKLKKFFQLKKSK